MSIAVRGPLFLLVKLLLPSRNANTAVSRTDFSSVERQLHAPVSRAAFERVIGIDRIGIAMSSR